MKLFKGLAFFVLNMSYSLGLTQELPPVQNFTPLEYQSENQNWAISQSEDKRMYVANSGGLLEFNGANWTFYPSPNETIMRSVRVIGDKIYTGCYMEFGYWERNSVGVLEYNSLSQNLKDELITDEEFWNIFDINDWVIFQSLNQIYIYNTVTNTFNVIKSDDVIVKMFCVDENVYFQKLNKGVFKIENGKDLMILDDEVLKSDEVVNIFPNEKDLIILTRNNGFYSFSDEVLKELPADPTLSSMSVYSAIQLSNKKFVLGTISHGLVFLDEERRLLLHLNQSNGLLNNTVLSVYEDLNSNIWAGLDNGVSYVNVDAPVKFYKDRLGVLGSVYASAIHNDYLYFGTNQGLFFKPLNENADFQLIEGTNGQVWSLEVIDGQLFCGHHNGTFVIAGNKAQQIAKVQGTWNIDKIDERDLIIQGNYDGLYTLQKNSGTWEFKNKIEGFDVSSRYFEVLGDKIFVNHEYKGVFELTVDGTFSQVIALKIDSLLKGSNSSITNYNGNVLYASKDGIFKYDEIKRKFDKDSILSSTFTQEEYVSGKMVSSDDKDELWFFTKNNLTLISSDNLSNSPKAKYIPLTHDVRRDVIEYENIISVDGLNKYLIGTSSGYIVFDANDLQTENFNVYLGSISSGINEDHSATENLIDSSSEGSFSGDENNFRISYYTPEYYQYFQPTYQFQLLGIYDAWSEWSSFSSIFFKNLPPGNYTFNVRAKIGEKISENVAAYRFSIAKPWYIRDYMVVAYLVAVILFSIFMHNVYRQYYRVQQQKLIEKNKKDLELAKLQNEKEITDLKNEQLARDYKSKSNELAASTMSLVRKNELLTQIKEQLTKVDDKYSVSPVIKIIDKNLNHTKNWELFREAFDNADSEFFKKLKELYPDLSPNDLKLCAYLRLNLSSKEIAPLINISPRSVEIKRYRLRKKMNLASNENLTNYIIGL